MAHCAINRIEIVIVSLYTRNIIYKSIGVCEKHVHQSLGSEPAAFRVTSRNSSKTSRCKHQVISSIRSAPAAYPFRLSLSHGPGTLPPPPSFTLRARITLSTGSLFSSLLHPFRSRTIVRRSGAVVIVDSFPFARSTYTTPLRASLQLASHPVHPARWR